MNIVATLMIFSYKSYSRKINAKYFTYINLLEISGPPFEQKWMNDNKMQGISYTE